MSKRSPIALDDLTANNVGILKQINKVTLPMTYPDSWYKESLTLTDGLVKLAYFNEIPVGAIRCELQVPQQHTVPSKIYIMTLAVLSPYRNYGIGTKLLDYVINNAKKIFIHEIYVHVWIKNEEAIEWYLKRGFKKNEIIKNYYKKLDNSDAIVLTLEF